MLHAVLDQIPRRLPGASITVLTTYPSEDREALEHPDVEIVSATPRQILFPMLPLALVAFALRLLRLDPRRLIRSGAVGALLRADVVLDLAGISFSSGRGIPLLAYNSLMTGIPILTGRPVIKCSQALGPFDDVITRTAARTVLGRLASICARGPRTHAHVEALRLSTRVVEAADLAFCMDVPDTAIDRARLLAPAVPYVTVAPSAVVRAYCDEIGVDYVGLMCESIDRITSSGFDVALMPHSYRPTNTPSRMNDGPLCDEILAGLADSNRATLIAGTEPPTVLRALIGKSEALVTSRFHGMISALATATPVVVVGWSHKYQEVMDAFELAHCVMPFDDADQLPDQIGEVLDSRASIVDTIERHLPEVTRSAERNFDEVELVLS